MRYAAPVSEHHSHPHQAVPAPGHYPAPGPYPAPGQGAPPRRRANAAASVIAGMLGVITAAVVIWFAFWNIDGNGPTEQWTDQAWVNVLAGFIGGVWFLVASGFTFARRLGGVWSLFVMALVFMVLEFLTPLLWGTDFGTHMDFLFGFHKTNGVIAGLATIFGFLTMIAAAVAGASRQSASNSTHVA